MIQHHQISVGWTGKVVLFSALALALAGCGGSSDSSTASESITNTTDALPTNDAATTESNEAFGQTPEPNTGTITVGDETWAFIADRCVNNETALGVTGHADDDADVMVEVAANTDVPSVSAANVGSGTDFGFAAGDEWTDAGATIPVVTVADGVARGTATFVDVISGETADGSFAFNCPAAG